MEEHYNQTWVKLKRPWTRQGEPYNTKKRIYGDDTAFRINTQPYPFNPPPFAKDFSLGYDLASYDSLKERWKYHDTFVQHHTPTIGMAPVATHAPPPPITPTFALGSTSSTHPKHARSLSDPSIGLSASSPLFTPSKPSAGSTGSGPSTPFFTPTPQLKTPGSGASGSSATYLQALATPTSFTPKKTLAVQFLEFKGLSNTTGSTPSQFITNKKLDTEYKKFCALQKKSK